MCGDRGYRVVGAERGLRVTGAQRGVRVVGLGLRQWYPGMGPD